MTQIAEQPVLRQATAADAALLAGIEARCFPPAEAAGLGQFEARLAVFPRHFLIAGLDGVPVGFVNGMVIDAERIDDVMYADAKLHNESGAWQSVFGLNVLFEHRRRGIAARLLQEFIDQARAEGRRGCVLTCKDYMLHYYARFGFERLGESASTHGGARWHDMKLVFSGV